MGRPAWVTWTAFTKGVSSNRRGPQTSWAKADSVSSGKSLGFLRLSTIQSPARSPTIPKRSRAPLLSVSTMSRTKRFSWAKASVIVSEAWPIRPMIETSAISTCSP